MPKKIKKELMGGQNKSAIDRLTTLIIGIYYAVLAGLVLCLIAAEAEALIHSLAVPKYSQDWRILIYSVYYAFPFIFGIGFGLTFKPFWKNFRNVTIVIFIIHFLYSAVLYVVRLNAEAQWQKDIHSSEIGQIAVKQFKSTILDEPWDGFADKVILEMEADTARLNPGEYSLKVELSQSDQPLPEGKVDLYRFKVGENGSSVLKLSFEADAASLNRYFRKGPVDVDLQLQKTMALPRDVLQILFWARWAPFLKVVSWEGHDPVLNDTILDIQDIRRVGSLSVTTMPSIR